jgi:ABC-2 type transport system ATP-binding protein
MTIQEGHVIDSRIRVDDVSFRYGSNPVLRDLSFAVGNGILGVLGPNGAGKSTLFDTLATIRRPTTGSISILGVPADDEAHIRQIRRHVGFLPQRFNLMAFSSCLNNVAYAAWCNGVSSDSVEDAATSALRVVGLESRAQDRAGSLSGGQKQRLGIACAIAHGPRVLLLDEPTVGLDPGQRIEIRDHLRGLASDTCIVVATHIVEDVRSMASEVMVLSEGRRAFMGSVDDLESIGRARPDPKLTPLESGYMSVLREVEA